MYSAFVPPYSLMYQYLIPQQTGSEWSYNVSRQYVTNFMSKRVRVPAIVHDKLIAVAHPITNNSK